MYPFAYFNNTTIDVCEWISNFIRPFTGCIINYSYKIPVTLSVCPHITRSTCIYRTAKNWTGTGTAIDLQKMVHACRRRIRSDMYLRCILLSKQSFYIIIRWDGDPSPSGIVVINFHFIFISYYTNHHIWSWICRHSTPSDIGMWNLTLWIAMTCLSYMVDLMVTQVISTIVSVSRSRVALHWHHNECDGVSNHQHHDCLLNRLFKVQIKENIKAPRHWPFWGEFTADRWIPRTKGQ